MASGNSRKTVFAFWNAEDETQVEHSAENRKSQNVDGFILESQRSLPEWRRNSQGTSREHVSRASDTACIPEWRRNSQGTSREHVSRASGTECIPEWRRNSQGTSREHVSRASDTECIPEWRKNSQGTSREHVSRASGTECIPERRRNLQGTSCEHVSRASDTECNDSYNIHQRFRSQKHSSQNFSHANNRRLTSDDSNVLKQSNHLKNSDFAKRYSKSPAQYENSQDKSYKTFNKARSRLPPNGINRYGQDITAKDYISYPESQENTSGQVKPENNGHNEVPGPISYVKLKNFIQKDADEILLTLNNPYHGFLQLIRSQRISDPLMSCVLIALGKISKSKMRENVLAFVNSVTSNRVFFFSLQMHMIFLQSQPDDTVLDELQHLIGFLKIFVDSQPVTASETVPALQPLLLQTAEKCVQNSSMRNRVKDSLHDIIEQIEMFAKKHTKEEIVQATPASKLQLQKPPEDFHEIPTLPGEHDIYNYQPFLRPNIVRGRYLDVNHYLDVQFRLLREDFVRPLREGITEFKILKNKEQARKCKDLRVYLNVRVIRSLFVHGTLAHLLQFGATKFKKVAWEYSKRFLTGSLLCLSADNFQTMLFATVLDRDPKNLTKGLLLIKFEELADNVHSITPLTDFVVLETEAYFEAYRHVLLALQNISDLPLKKYIVDVEKHISHPQYLSNYTTYNISPLLLPMSISYTDESNIASSRAKRLKNIENRHLESLPILNDSLWPKEDEVDLDASQLKALKVALTKEFSVIQGPPGTGKTYIGLRIVQLLLHNTEKWNTSKSPILVVCYTNHALDQFLEGILNFTQKVGRIGGRCKSEKVEPYLLRNLRSKMRMGKKVPNHIFSSIKEKTTLLSFLHGKVSETEHLMQKGIKTVLGEVVLNPYMKNTHYMSLKESVVHLRSDPFTSSTLDDGHIIYDWLEVRYRGFELGGLAESVFTMNLNGKQEELGLSNDNSQYDKLRISKDKDDTNEKTDDSESERSSEAEDDIDFIEAMREIDEDFSGVDFSLHETVVEHFPVAEKGGWKTQKGRKNQTKFIQKMLRQTEVMTSEEADKVVDIWKLRFEDRWRLYGFWLKSYFSAKQEEIGETQQKIYEEYNQLDEIKLAEDLHVLQDLKIVGMTTTGAAKYRNILQTLNPRIVIVEEAAEILESHVITSLAPDTQHLILIGDHQQLRPSPTVYQLATRYNLNVSLFERMIKNNLEPCVLSIQHRMRPTIAALLVPHIYAELKNHESVLSFENIKGVSSNVFFLNHVHFEGGENDSASKVNSHEALFLVKFCRYLLLQGYLASQITILTAYSGQLILLKKLTNKNPLYRGVRITVVDNFQGEENDIILISFVRSNEEGLIGFLKTANRVCVALSRAKKGLYCIGNFMLLAEQSKLWKDILATLENQDAVGDALELCCQNHPNCSNFISSSKDFNLVPEGGCTRPCEYRLKCGHTCTRMCHPYDPLHEYFECQKECDKILCELGHACQRPCYQQCGECCVEVFKVIPHCQHEVLVPCHLDPTHFKCSFACIEQLPCGHFCTRTCGDVCVIQCQEKVTVPSPCGHIVSISCFQTESVLSAVRACDKICNAELDCGHLCSGTCSKCYQGRLHRPCKNPCQRILVCGHECNSECAQNCPPCKEKCQNRCIHSKCSEECGIPCNPCKEKCEWKCAHKECTRLCSEPCDRSPCDMPCLKLLPCGHNCAGLCGEPCPKLCSVCHSAQLREMFFGTENDEDARFVMLEDCGHVFEEKGLTQWMKLDSSGSGKIQMKCCPRCERVIVRNSRFNNVIKACLSNVAKVKSFTFGEEQKIKHNKRSLLRRLKAELHLSESLKESIINFLKERNVSIWDVERCENVIDIAASFQEICLRKLDIYFLVHGRSRKDDFSFTVKSGDVDTDGFIDCVRETVALIKTFLYKEYKTATFQQMKEVTHELQRFKFLVTAWGIFQENGSRTVTDEDAQSTFARIVNHFCSIRFTPFTDSEEERLRISLVEILKQKCSFSVLSNNDAEKKLILRSLNLSVGHWYQCPNGHVYCITRYGSTTLTGKCNECEDHRRKCLTHLMNG